MIRRGRALIGNLIERGIERGEFRANGIQAYPQIIVGGPMLALLWTQLFARCEPLDLEAYVDVFADTLLEGMLPRAGSLLDIHEFKFLDVQKVSKFVQIGPYAALRGPDVNLARAAPRFRETRS